METYQYKILHEKSYFNMKLLNFMWWLSSYSCKLVLWCEIWCKGVLIVEIEGNLSWMSNDNDGELSENVDSDVVVVNQILILSSILEILL